MNFLEKLVEMWKSSRNIFHHQRIWNRFLPTGSLTWLFLIAVGIFLIRKCKVIVFESFKKLSINSLLVADQSSPELSTIAHWDAPSLYFFFQLFISVMLSSKHQGNVFFDPFVKLLFCVLILKVLEVVLCTLQLLSGYVLLELVTHCAR